MKNMTTITITVNVATGNRWEGNSELQISLTSESELGRFNAADYAPEISLKVSEAIREYKEKNLSDRTLKGRPIQWNGEGNYRFVERDQEWQWVRQSMVQRVEAAGEKIVYVRDADTR